MYEADVCFMHYIIAVLIHAEKNNVVLHVKVTYLAVTKFEWSMTFTVCICNNNHPCFDQVRLRDPVSLQCEHMLEAHTGTLSDFDVSGNLLVTCGFCSRY